MTSGFPLTWKEFRDYVRAVSTTNTSPGANIVVAHDGKGNAFEPWYIMKITRQEMRQDGNQIVPTSYETVMQFTAGRIGEFNMVEVLQADDCRLKPEAVQKACQDLHIPVPPLDTRPTQRETTAPNGDRRREYFDPDNEQTTVVEFYDATTGVLVQRETMDATGKAVEMLETFDRNSGDALSTVIDPEPGEGR